MIKSKIISIFKHVYIFLILITLVNIIYSSFNFPKSKYSIDEEVIFGKIIDFNIDGNNLKIILKGKEKILVNYYFSEEKEKNESLKKYKLGQLLKLTGYFKLPSENRNFNLFNYRKYLLSLKINYIFVANGVDIIESTPNLLYTLKNNILDKINNLSDSTYVKAFVLGITNEIDSYVMSSYQENGINHLFAISGMHITLLSVILLKILSILSKNLKLNYVITISLLMFYMFLTNFTPSVLRATFLFIALTIKRFVYIPFKTYHILIFIASVLLLFNPYYLFHVGFQFSFIISFYLILCYKKINEINGYFKKVFVTSLIAFLTSIPILINNFFTINILSVVYNVFYIPFVSFIVFPLSLISIIVPDFNYLLIIITTFMENVSLNLSNITLFTLYFSKLPLFFFFFYYILITIIILDFRHKRRISTIILFFCLVIHYNINIFSKVPTITLIDVGQGDSILIKLPYDRANILIDAGGIVNFNQENWQKKNKEFDVGKSIVLPYLKSVGIKRLDYLITTHGDFDHIGGAMSLVKNFKVNNVVFNNGSYNQLEKELITVLNIKNINYYKGLKEINLNKYKLEFLNTGIYDNENDNSNVIYFNYNNYKFLFMGDAGIKKEKDILEKYNLKNIDFLKVGHHGSNTSTSEDFINVVNPKYSLISVSENNIYGHPKKGVLETLSNTKIYRTDINGSIEIQLNKNGYKIKTLY